MMPIVETDCVCQELDSVLDPDAFDYDRAHAVVIYNNSGYMLTTCAHGHRASLFALMLCSPDYPKVAEAIERNHVVVKRKYDSLGHPARD
jgi:hypothetical protein|tara:strand:- start:756 stop:1025 length:270 start_codon:yes stop_codon:yes gene_type:complete